MDSSFWTYILVVTNIFMLLAVFVVLLYAFFLRQEHNRVRELRIELENYDRDTAIADMLKHFEVEPQIDRRPFDRTQD